MERSKKSLDEGFKIFEWTKTLLRLVGLCPLKPNYYLFNVCMFYLTAMVILEIISLYKSLEDVDSLIDVVTESSGFSYIYVCTLMLGVNYCEISQLLTEATTNYDISGFRNLHEIKVFMQFISIGKFLLKILIIYIPIGEVAWLVGPLMSLENAVDENNKTLFVLPFQIYLFYEINSAKVYYLTYFFLIPGSYFVAIGHMAAIAVLISVVVYISGKMAVLTMRIHAIKNNFNDYRNELNTIIAEHDRLLKMGVKLRDAYSITLLVYFVTVNFMIVMLGYQLLIGSIEGGQMFDMVGYVLYLVEIYLALSLYCFISEHLTAESLKIGEAFYNFQWFNLPVDCGKDIILCIERSQKPLGLRAGKFTTFSSVTLTDVTKTAVSYLGVLRNFMIVD